MRNVFSSTAIFSLILVVACTEAEPSRFANEQFEPGESASAEEMQAARNLSLVDSGNTTEGSPLEKAQRCSVAIGTLAERVETLGTLSGEQMQVLTDAKAVYDRRVSSEAAGSGQPAEDAPEVPVQQDPERSQVAEQARGAIACLRDLGLS